MTIVKNPHQYPIELPDGSMLAPGARAEGVDLDDPAVAAHVRMQGLLNAGADPQPSAPVTKNEQTAAAETSSADEPKASRANKITLSKEPSQ